MADRRYKITFKMSDGSEKSVEFISPQGEDGITPHIGDNGNWFIGETDTGVPTDGNVDLTGYVQSVNGQTPDENGNVEITIPEGSNGKDGKDGVSTTHRWDGTVLTITSASGTSSADLKGEPGKDGADGYTPVKGKDYFDGKDGADYVLTDADKAEIAETVKSEVPLVKSAEQPTIVSSIDEMTDTSKAYVLSEDGYFYKNMKEVPYVLTANDFALGSIGGYGNVTEGINGTRLATKELLPLTGKIISVNCPEPYQYIVYYFSGIDEELANVYIGKTSFKSGSIDDVTAETIASGTLEGATYCRVSLRDGTNASAILSGRIDEFMANVTVTELSLTGAEWKNTGLHYNMPTEIEDKIADLENDYADLSNKMDEIDAGRLFNPFALLPIYHHLNQEDIRQCDIPAQSIYDVSYAKSLGFSIIEVNPQKCADGVFVCKHGVGGTLGYGLKAEDGNDYSNTAFASVTSDWLRSNIKYTTIDKYSSHIPTLDEVCIECKKLSMMIKVGSMEAVEVARKYLPDDMIWSTQNERGNFRGLIEYVWYASQTIDNCISTCLNIGAPLNIVIAAGEFNTHTDDEIKELTQKAHRNGFTVGMVYPDSGDIVRALSLGVDAIGSVNNNINLFDIGDALNIKHLNNVRLNLADGVSYDVNADVITMIESSSVDVSADNISSGKLSLRIRYSGSITINDDMTYESDGTVVIPYAVVLQRKAGKTYDKWVTLTANSTTTIYDLSLSCSCI